MYQEIEAHFYSWNHSGVLVHNYLLSDITNSPQLLVAGLQINDQFDQKYLKLFKTNIVSQKDEYDCMNNARQGINIFLSPQK
jgi:hypothetical protein